MSQLTFYIFAVTDSYNQMIYSNLLFYKMQLQNTKLDYILVVYCLLYRVFSDIFKIHINLLSAKISPKNLEFELEEIL